MNIQTKWPYSRPRAATTAALAAAVALAISGGAASLHFSPIGVASAQDSHGSGAGGDSHKGSKGGAGKGAKKGSGSDTSSHGTPGGKSVESEVLRGSDAEHGSTEESSPDKKGPKYSGGKSSTGKPGGAGTKKGDLYGDVVAILRDANGVPILDQYDHVQPVNANGVALPLTPEGDVVAEYANLVVPVEFSRLSVARSPTKVMDKAYAEAISALNSADLISTDASGRLVVTVNGEAKTIDSPLENLALYQALMNNGYLPGLDLKSGVSLGSLSFLNVKSATNADFLQAAAFLAAASDKSGSINSDTVVYTDAFLHVVGTTPIVGADGASYVNFSTVSYDRAGTYTGDVTYLKSSGVGTYVSVTEPVMTAVFGGVNYTGTQVDGFTQAADDARAVIEFVHAHPVPLD